MGKTLIEAENIGKVYYSKGGDEVTALVDVSVKIYPQEFVTIVGSSGCGKTTFLKIIGGLIDKTSGTLTFKGEPISKPNKEIGIVFQKPVLLPWRCILDNVMLGSEIHGYDKKKYIQRAYDLLRFVGLEGFERRYPRELSGGMQQRAAFCRALLMDPSVLLMDEPFGALDALTRDSMDMWLSDAFVKEKKTILFVTHSISEAVFLADRIIVLSPRPGTINEIVNVDFPQPRELETITNPKFGELGVRVRRLIGKRPELKMV